ncbi:MAG: DUF11 domain-containing protein [Methanobacterium sp.]|uniref:beta strand repeat-containing protein n=1 Tax=Methanobacterium sp. TaxID=2164 RepID=UPI003D65B2CF|nr:DUF11 domain-containing protein [Methanobacterium sp.]
MYKAIKGGEKSLIPTAKIKIKNYHAYLIIIGAIILMASLSMQTASAADIYVNDTGSDTTGTGTIDNPYKTISYGITRASTTSTDTINLNAATFNTYNADATHRDYNITIAKNVNINGAGHDQTIINPAGRGWAFTVTAGFTVNISNLTITNGNKAGTGGAIQNAGTLTLTDCNFTSNTAQNGGAIYNTGTLTVTGSTFRSNRATGTGTNNGGAIWNSGTLTATGNNFLNNAADNNGGALYNNNGVTSTANLQFNRIIGNTAPTGSNIRQNGGTVTANNNWWGSNGGAVGISGFTVSTYLVLTVTPLDNFIPATSNSIVKVDLLHDNTGTYYDPASGHVPDGILVTLFALNPTTIGSLSQTTGTIVNGAATTTFTGNANTGTATVSATVDTITSSGTITIGGGKNDVYVSQTGNDTTGDGSQSRPYFTILKGYNSVYSRGNIHIIGSATSYTGASNKNLTINKNVNIMGESGTVTLDAQDSGRFFTINHEYTVTLSNITFTNGNVGTTANGGALYNDGNLTVTNCIFTGNDADCGGAIWNTMFLTVTDSNFTSNTAARDGGGICTGNGQTDPISSIVTVTNCIFTSNSAQWGGAIWNRSPSLTVTKSTFTSNTASQYGGAIRNWVNAVVTENTFTGNSATTGGAAISTYNGGSTIAHFNRLIGNGVNEMHLAAGTVDATDNWWGSNTSPSAKVDAAVNVSTWLILSITAVPDSIPKLANSWLTGLLTINSNGVDTSSLGHVPDGINMGFAFVNLGVNLGSVSPTTRTTLNGLATSTFTALNTNGVARVSTTVDGVTVYTDIVIGDRTDLAVTNTLDYDDSVVYLKDTGIFYITVHNNGPDDATGVTVTIQIPTGFQVLAINPHVGTYNAGTNTWTIGNLSNNGTAYLDLILKVIQPNVTLTTNATVTGTQEDPNMSNNVARKTVTISPSADIAVTQTVSNLTPNTGNPITITVTASNNGPQTANNVVVFYRPPAGLNAVVTPSAGTTYNSGTGQWIIGTLNNGDFATLNIAATVTAASGTIIKNTASCIQLTEIDNNNTNNQNTANIRVGGVSYTPSTWLRLNQYLYNPGYSHDPQTLYDTAMFYVDLRNYGPDDATGVNVAVTIPAGYTILAINPKQGTYNTVTNTWNLGNLCNGEWAYLDLVLKVMTANTALTTNTTVTQAGTNPNPTKSSPATINIKAASDIQVKQTVSNTHPTSGSSITYTITVTNNGPQATTLVINDLLSAALTFVSYTSTTGTYSSTSGNWTINNLGAGATATLTITANVNSGLPIGTIIKNNATITSLTGTDPNQTDISKITTIQTQ